MGMVSALYGEQDRRRVTLQMSLIETDAKIHLTRHERRTAHIVETLYNQVQKIFHHTFNYIAVHFLIFRGAPLLRDPRHHRVRSYQVASPASASASATS